MNLCGKNRQLLIAAKRYCLFGKRYLSGGTHKGWDVKMNIHKVDYRKFSDMYFDRNSYPLEIHNGIQNNRYKNSIK